MTDVAHDRPVIVFTLNKAPGWGETAHMATATCPHGVTQYTIFGRDETLKREHQGLARSHILKTRCFCVKVELVLETNAETP